MKNRNNRALKAEKRRIEGCLAGSVALLVLACAALGLVIAGILDDDGFHFDAIDVAPLSQVAEEPDGDAVEDVGTADEGDDGEEGGEEAVKDYSADLEGYYFYSQLDEADRQSYETMYRMAVECRQVDYPCSKADDLDRIYNCVMGDHPEFFYIKGLVIDVSTDSDMEKIEGDYLYSQDQIASYQPQIEAAIAGIAAGIPDDADDYAKAKYVYEYLAANVRFDHDAIAQNDADPNSYLGQTVVDSLIYGNAVCAGYARTFQMVMQQMGIQCAYVQGNLNDGSGSHSWCLVLLDGEYYYVDPTWGDPDSSDDRGGQLPSDFIDYAYLGTTTADMQASRDFDAWQPLPECTSTADNYYVYEGRMLDWADGALIQQWWDEAVVNGDASFQFRCSDASVYQEVLDGLANGTLLFADANYYYVSYDDVLAITVQPGA